ncbi:MAG: N-acetyltransferase [Anaerolineae bacterium]|jgi:putative acetyltransferase|nr:N-acetyltransferase [Anaerolineae bacterium]
MEIRKESPEDAGVIRQINQVAFGHPEEAQLVDDLREAGALLLSMVACDGEQVVGHIAYSRGWIECEGERIPSVALAPMAVLPDYQSKGVGSILLSTSLYTLREMGEAHVFVLGHTWFYPRFGFVPADQFQIASVYQAGDHFMGQELSSGALEGVEGHFMYHPAFEGV